MGNLGYSKGKGDNDTLKQGKVLCRTTGSGKEMGLDWNSLNQWGCISKNRGGSQVAENYSEETSGLPGIIPS